jgi:hypothetical protein
MTKQGFELDKHNPEWIKAWGIIRFDPWDVAGTFTTREEAETELKKYGADYQIEYGSRKLGSNDFVINNKP